MVASVFILLTLPILRIWSLTLTHTIEQNKQSKFGLFSIRTCQNISKYLTANLQDLGSPLKFETEEQAGKNGREILQFTNQNSLQVLQAQKQASSHHLYQQDLHQGHHKKQDWSLWQTWLLPPQKIKQAKQTTKRQSWVISSRPAPAQKQEEEATPEQRIGIKPSGIVFNKRSLLLDTLSNINSNGNSVLYSFADCLACTDDISTQLGESGEYSIKNIELTQVNKLSTVASFMWVDEDGDDGDVVFLNKDKNSDELKNPLSCFLIQKRELSKKPTHEQKNI